VQSRASVTRQDKSRVARQCKGSLTDHPGPAVRPHTPRKEHVRIPAAPVATSMLAPDPTPIHHLLARGGLHTDCNQHIINTDPNVYLQHIRDRKNERMNACQIHTLPSTHRYSPIKPCSLSVTSCPCIQSTGTLLAASSASFPFVLQ
jgi:hypothetical protein